MSRNIKSNLKNPQNKLLLKTTYNPRSNKRNECNLSPYHMKNNSNMTTDYLSFNTNESTNKSNKIDKKNIVIILSLTLNISVCLVVCLPRLIFSLISPVCELASGINAFNSDDLPTPDGPANAVVLPSITLSTSSIPIFSLVDVNIT